MRSRARSRVWWLASGALLLLGGGAAVAHFAPLSIQPVFARAELQLTGPPTVTACQGVDGTYTLTHLEATGPITSADPRLTGTFHANARLFHNQQGVGISEDHFTVTDPVTGKVKMRGTAYAMDDGAAPIKGQAIATLADGTRFWAMSTVRLPAPNTTDPLVIEYGGTGANVPDKAVTLSGVCGDSEKMFPDDDDDDDHGHGHH